MQQYIFIKPTRPPKVTTFQNPDRELKDWQAQARQLRDRRNTVVEQKLRLRNTLLNVYLRGRMKRAEQTLTHQL